MISAQHSSDTNLFLGICSLMGFQLISSVCLLIEYLHP
jgi:hypothetical protein